MQVVVKAKYYIHTYGPGSITWEKRYVWWTINQGQAEYYVHSSSSTAEEPRERRIMIKRAKLRKEPQIGLDFQREEALQNININRRLCNLALSARWHSCCKTKRINGWTDVLQPSLLPSPPFISSASPLSMLVLYGGSQKPKTYLAITLSVEAWAWWIAFLGWIM